jgi:superfamily II DNA or RNA helicase
MDDSSTAKVINEKLNTLYEQYTDGIIAPLPLKEMLSISQDLSDEIDLYKHCEYQAMIAASIVSQDSSFIIATIPTGSGKTWI